MDNLWINRSSVYCICNVMVANGSVRKSVLKFL